MTVATAVGIALFGDAAPTAAVELPNPETAGNRSVRFAGGIKKASQSTPLLAVTIVGPSGCLCCLQKHGVYVPPQTRSVCGGMTIGGLSHECISTVKANKKCAGERGAGGAGGGAEGEDRGAQIRRQVRRFWPVVVPPASCVAAAVRQMSQCRTAEQSPDVTIMHYRFAGRSLNLQRHSERMPTGR